MPFQVIDGGDLRHEFINAIIYGLSGAGKTSLAFTARDPIVFDFDRGTHRAPNRFGKKVVRVSQWSDCSNIVPADFTPYGAAVVDTVDNCLETIMTEIIRRNPRAANDNRVLYGELKVEFSRWLGVLRSSRLDVVLLAHTEEVKKDDTIIEQPLIRGASRNIIQGVADIGGRLYVTGEGQRRLDFNPSPTSRTKNGAALPVYDVPHIGHMPDLMARIINQARQNINDGIMGHDEETAVLTDLREQVSRFQTPQEFTDLYLAMLSADAPKSNRAIVVRGAKARGYFADRVSHRFFENEPACQEWHKQQQAQPAAAPAQQPAQPAAQPAQQPAQPAAQQRQPPAQPAAAPAQQPAQPAAQSAAPPPAEPAAEQPAQPAADKPADKPPTGGGEVVGGGEAGMVPNQPEMDIF